MKPKKYYKNHSIDYISTYILTLKDVQEDYKTGKEIANLICDIIRTESKDFLQGFMDRINEGV